MKCQAKHKDEFGKCLDAQNEVIFTSPLQHQSLFVLVQTLAGQIAEGLSETTSLPSQT